MTRLRKLFGSIAFSTIISGIPLGAVAQGPPGAGQVAVINHRLFRDGQPWTPHGYFQIAFAAPPGAFHIPGENPVFAEAYKAYMPSEYYFMRRAGADSVRINLAQDGSDPTNTAFFDPGWFDQAVMAIRAARQAGLTVIVSIQDETQTGVTTKAPLPDDGTRRVWARLAPIFARDHGVLYELYNEPNVHPTNPIDVAPSASDWTQWKIAMDQTLQVVRHTGATNVVVADGLASAQQLSGALELDDSTQQFVFASHPYPNNNAQEQQQSWDQKFGDFAATHPVIITEWGVGYYCDSQTPVSVTNFLSYINQRHIGLEAVAWDWPKYSFASAMQDFPNSTVSSLLNQSTPNACTTANSNSPGVGSGASTSFGPGRVIQTWYTTGLPPGSPQ